MKRIIYSPIVKLLAVLLCISAAGFGAGFLSQLIEITNNYDIFSSDLERDYGFSSTLSSNAMHILSRIQQGSYDEIRIDDRDRVLLYYLSVPSEGIEMGDAQLGFDMSDEYGCEVVVKDGVFNIDANTGSLQSYVRNNILSDGASKRIVMPDMTLIMKYTGEYVKDYTISFNYARQRALNAVKYGIIFALAVILLCIYLGFVCGRRAADREVHLILQDRIPPEVQLAIGIGAGVGAAALALAAMDVMYAQEGIMKTYFSLCAGLGAAAIATLVIAVFTSLLRMTKARKFLHSCLTYKIVKLLWRIFVKLSKLAWKYFVKVMLFAGGLIKKIWLSVKQSRRKIHAFFDAIVTYKSSKAAVGIIIFIALLCLAMGVCISFGSLVIAALLCAFVISKTVLITKDLEKIGAAVKKMSEGELECEIATEECQYFSGIANALNSISDGMKAAVEKNVAAERMKTELITNVSHDLKTPLTSIISYSDLLCDMKLTPEEANDYAQIIRKKGERLKNLTQDLFDVSKVQSGSESVDWERLDLPLLVSQSLGEADAGLAKAELSTVISLEKELFIKADGKKLSRVFANLIGNIEKYAQKNTRVFVSAKRQANRVRVEFKNTSALPLDFNTEEITERFVRGDKSRSTEGSGLGLAIAKSYTELCGGSFRIETDGDLFKVIVVFPIAE